MPTCGGEARQVGKIWMCPEHGPLPKAAPAADAQPVKRRLYDDLTAAGFTVWFDRESLLSRGVTFHQEIKGANTTFVGRCKEVCHDAEMA